MRGIWYKAAESEDDPVLKDMGDSAEVLRENRAKPPQNPRNDVRIYRQVIHPAGLKEEFAGPPES